MSYHGENMTMTKVMARKRIIESVFYSAMARRAKWRKYQAYPSMSVIISGENLA
jgi:hypothetical protein